MTPLERAARAAYRELKDDLDVHQMGEDYMWEDQLPLVRAVVTAIREPSEEMGEAGAEIIRNVSPDESEDAYKNDAVNTWRYMIDAALEDGPTGGT